MATTSEDGVGTNLSTKRVRSWESCDDVQELKRMLMDQQEEINRVVTETDKQLTALQRKLKLAKSHAASGPAGPPSSTPAANQVARLRKSIQSQVLSQMAYKPSTKYGSARLVPLEIYDTREAKIEALIGEELSLKASSGPKQLEVEFSNDDVEKVFQEPLRKFLRYDATLELTQGLKLLLTKADGLLKVTGNYTMVK